jgi:phosphoribosylaminoimidazolecarboxamide formyltransferase/IMP cyclohydrolase
MKYALISVSDKSGVQEFAKGLVNCGFDIISTGGTAKALRDAGIKVSDISEFTGFPEILDGRLKTLHPLVHGGILSIRKNGEHVEAVKKHSIKYIDIVAVNLYPFESAVTGGADFQKAVENIDIGGPAMIRSAAKNHEDVTVIVSRDDYPVVLKEIEANGVTTAATRKILAAKAFSHTALYDSVIADWFNEQLGVKFPQEYTTGGRLIQSLRYGENPHQDSAFYRTPLSKESGAVTARQLQGKELSYNNIVDIEATTAIVKEFSEPAAIIVKHTNPCGAAVAANIKTAYDLALAADPTSAFGGIAAFNREVEIDLAEKLTAIFLEVIIAPSFSEDAIKRLSSKKNLRLMTIDFNDIRDNRLDFKKITGGFLLQDRDLHSFETFENLNVPTKRKPTGEELKNLNFAWIIAKYIKSNAIIYAKDLRTVGIGAGQMSRVDSSKIASFKALTPLNGCVMASDAFFPFRDSVDEAASKGITAIISPGGSIRDNEVIEAADEADIAMVFTGIRHFRH